MACISCGKKLGAFESEYICDECLGKIKGTATEYILKAPDKFLPPILTFLQISSFLLLAISLLWYFYIPDFTPMKLIFILLLATPISLHAILTIKLMKTVQKAPELKECIQKKISLYIIEILPNIILITLISIVGIFLFEIWDFIISILTWLWTLISGVF